jgi:hypothetical protein
MNGEVEQGIERFGGVLEGRPRPTPGCSAIKEEEEEFNKRAFCWLIFYNYITMHGAKKNHNFF